MATVALQFELDQILVASAKLVGKRLQVQNLYSIPLEGDDAETASQLKESLSQFGLTRSDAIVVVSRANVEMRELTVPPAPNNELPDMVRFIARSEFASLNDNWAFDYVPMSNNETIQRSVLAAGISPELHQQIKTIVEPSGLKVKHIVMRPFASIDLIHGKLVDGKCRLIVDPNGDTTDMTIVDGSKLLATRSVRVPEKSDPNKRADTLLSEVRRTIASSRKSLGDKKVSSVIMYGPADQNKFVEGNLKSHLDLEVDFVNPLQHAPTASGLKEPQRAERYAALLGSLVQHSSSDSHTLDFVNPRRPIVKKADFSKWYSLGGIGLAALLLACIGCWLWLNGKANENEKLQRQVIDLRDKNNGLTGDKIKVDQVLNEIAEIDRFKLEEVNWLEQLNHYSKNALGPDETIVDTFDSEVKAVVVDDSGARVRKGVIIAKTRLASNQAKNLERELKTKFERVKNEGNSRDESDKTYPEAVTYRLTMERDDKTKLDEISKRAREFVQGENSDAPASNSPQSE